MKQDQFWKEVQVRMGENRRLMRGGLPSSFAGVMNWVGLRFWVVGAFVSLIGALMLWMIKYGLIMRIVRGLIWR